MLLESLKSDTMTGSGATPRSLFSFKRPAVSVEFAFLFSV